MQAYLQPFDARADLGEQQHGEHSDGQGAGGLPHDHSRGSSSGPGRDRLHTESTAGRPAPLLGFRGLSSKGSGRGTHLFLALSLSVPPVCVCVSPVVSTYHG